MTVSASKYPIKKNDLYETEEWAVYAVVRVLKLLGLWRKGTVWEPSAGNHRMVGPLYEEGAAQVVTSDICSYGHEHTFLLDFLSDSEPDYCFGAFDVITNPPYGWRNALAHEYVEKALERCDGVVALLMTAKFDFGNTRTHMFRNNPRFRAKVALIDRISWENNGETGTEDHAWYIWGPKGEKPAAPILAYEGKPKV